MPAADHFSKAINLHLSGLLDAALQEYLEILEKNPAHAGALSNLATLYLQRFHDAGDHENLKRAEGFLERCLLLNPSQPALRRNFLMAYVKAGLLNKALEEYDQLLKLNCHSSEIALLVGALALDSGFPAVALEKFDAAIALNTGEVNAWYNRGNALRVLRRFDEAMSSYRRCIRLRANHVEAHINMGVLLQDIKQSDLAIAYYDEALQLRPESVTAAYNRALALENMRQLDRAIESYESLLAREPEYPYLLGRLYHARMQLCDWSRYEEDVVALKDRVLNQQAVIVPFPFLAVTDDLVAQVRCASTYVNDKFPVCPELLEQLEKTSGRRLRVGYFSSDLRTHAVGFLIAGLFETHDRHQFEIFAFSSGKVDETDLYYQRISSGCEHFVDTSCMSDAELVALARSLCLDVAVDLAGHTLDARTAVFAQRVAPVQINYLGYPGSMGAPYIDYIIADGIVIPQEYESLYAERVIRLPETFQVNDRQRAIAAVQPRKTYGLPDKGIVLASFNTSYKLNPVMFDSWCRILKANPSAVLWLLAENPIQIANLQGEAASRGVDTNRLIFAGRMDYAEHLARYAHVDLVLDTFPFNGGTSTSDALWGGAPVLTCAGESFASRMSASLLRAAGLPELVADGLDRYESCASYLLQHLEKLRGLRQRLAINRLQAPLFNTEAWTRHIESIYLKLADRVDSNDLKNAPVS